MNTKFLVAIVSAITATTSFLAKADGFICQSLSEDLSVKVYNHTQAELGVRNAAVMVVSDPRVQFGRKTIARFSSAQSTLSNEGAAYLAKVDLRYNDSERRGEDIGATKLGELSAITLDVAFSYQSPLLVDEETTGLLVLHKRNGDELEYDMVCWRYLKGE